MKILVIEDDHDLQILIKNQLQKEGFAIDVAGDGEDGYYLASETSYDCLILDINLPGIDGLEICNKLRRQKITTPILMLTARGDIDDRVRGLNVGADDYVNKPVDSRELIARVRALIRRSSKEPLPMLQVGDLMIDPQAQTAVRNGQLIILNPKEFLVLEFLMRHSHEMVTRTMLMEHVWGSDFETLSNVVDVYIRYLRKKIDLPGLQPLIHTIRGGGYMLSDLRTKSS